MSGYYHECPRCNNVTPIDPNDVLHHATRPDVSCYDCGAHGCVTCMPEEVCSDCDDLLDEDEEWLADALGFEEDLDAI